jgi:hypothetical protein
MTALKAPFLILGYLASLLGLSALSDAPDASDGLLQTPSATIQEYAYGEAPLEALTAPTTSSTTTTVWVEPQPKSDCEIALQLALDVGWPASEMATLANVLWRESRCTPDAYNELDPMGGSHGYMQINSFWCKPNSNWPQGWLQTKGIVITCHDLYDPATNLRAGLAIYRNSGWHPWGIK